MQYVLSEASKAHRAGVDQRLIEISDLAIQLTLVDFGHDQHSGKRTAKEQYSLHVGGNSKADGYLRKSKHQTGRALDFFAFVDGAVSYKREHLAMVACAFLQAASMLGYRVRWGGLWPSKNGGMYGWDMPHIELIDD